MVIVELTQTCDRSPSQWEGRLADGRAIYIRYRHGELSVNLSPPGGTIGDALDAQSWFDEADGTQYSDIDLAQVLERTGLVLAAAAR